MTRLSAYVGDGHKYILPVAVQPGYENWIGSTLIAIGPTSTATILESVAGVRSGDSIPVTLRDRAGAIHRVRLASGPPPTMQGVPKLMTSRLHNAPPAPTWLRDVSRNFWTALESDGSLYVRFNQVEDRDGET